MARVQGSVAYALDRCHGGQEAADLVHGARVPPPDAGATQQCTQQCTQQYTRQCTRQWTVKQRPGLCSVLRCYLPMRARSQGVQPRALTRDWQLIQALFQQRGAGFLPEE